jgi:hypothetical protein
LSTNRFHSAPKSAGPIVGTNENTDQMHASTFRRMRFGPVLFIRVTVCPCTMELVELDRDYGPYERGGLWAKRDAGQAVV